MAIIQLFFFVIFASILFFIVSALLRANENQRRLEKAFYHLLEREKCRISTIQLSVVAQVDADIAKPYLERQAKAFGATLEVDVDGDPFYRFPKLRPSDSALE
ncbi:hypothetical protein JJD41_23230 [Oxynema sp. CENA135]|uniref:hypothetical protein n=1 Tax=Oxynema sp. CENA135 TaxID=984206 RepID=UPI001909A789|nr:hypothetical protein [Oxynema sp. CENA135]MBK4732756.1 hypothetical protein [Oxynema sp. CENA135]